MRLKQTNHLNSLDILHTLFQKFFRTPQPPPSLHHTQPQVARPGPADGKLWGGDIITAIDGKSVQGQGPGRVISQLIGAGQETGYLDLTVTRGRDVEDEKLERTCPGLPPPLPKHTLERDPLKMASGNIGFSSVLKIMRMLDILPAVMLESELLILADEVRAAHVPDRDGEMIFSFDEFRTLLIVVVKSQKYFDKVYARITSQVAKKCYRRLPKREQQLGALFIVMQLPRRNLPGGVGWIKLRYYRYVAFTMIHQQASAGHASSFSDMKSNIEIKIMSSFQNAKELVLSDGVSQVKLLKCQHYRESM